jgi:hypothetical protein
MLRVVVGSSLCGPVGQDGTRRGTTIFERDRF